MPTEIDLTAYYAFDAGAGSGIPTEDVWETFAKHIMLPGVVAGEPAGTTPNTTEFEVYGDSTGRQVKVRIGRALMFGHPGWTTAETTMAIDTADATNPRIDIVVLRLDRTANKMMLAIKLGTPAASPTAPGLTQTAAVHEELLAEVTVAAGAVTITAANVVSKRRFAVPDTRGLPTAKVVRSSNQTGIVSGVGTAIIWTTVAYQTGGLWWYAATPTRFYVPRAGLYNFNARVRWELNASGARSVSLRLNGATSFSQVQDDAAAGGEFIHETNEDFPCALGDYVEVIISQTSGGDRVIEATGVAPMLSSKLLRAL